MKAICLYFQVHQPFRLKTYRFFDIGQDNLYFDESQNAEIMQKVAEKCYLPANKIIHDLIIKNKGKFKVSFSISGAALDQFQQYAPDVLNSFQNLVSTGCVELLAETYPHALSSLIGGREFKKQVQEHVQKIQALFGVIPKVFRNTELVYNDQIAAMVAEMGFNAVLTEGAPQVLGKKSPNHLYYSAANPQLKLLLRNYQLSDDIAFRFSDQCWGHWPLSVRKYAQWLNNIPNDQEIINLFMDYETFGEHQWAGSGIFNFLQDLPREVFKLTSRTFTTPSEVVNVLQPKASLTAPDAISWADEAKDLSAWMGNALQKDAFKALYKLKKQVRKCSDMKILNDWKYLQTSDHFYYMCTKNSADGEVHQYFNPYSSPYLAFINYMNVLGDFEIRVHQYLKRQKPLSRRHHRLAEKMAIDNSVEL